MSRSRDEVITALLAKDQAEQQEHPSRELETRDVDYKEVIPDFLGDTDIFIALLASGKDKNPYFFPATLVDSKYLLRAALLAATLNHFAQAQNELGAECTTLLTTAKLVFNDMSQTSLNTLQKSRAVYRATRFKTALNQFHDALERMPPNKDIAVLSRALALTTQSCALEAGKMSKSYQEQLDELSTKFQVLYDRTAPSAPAYEAKAEDEFVEPTPAPAAAVVAAPLDKPTAAPAPATAAVHVAEASRLWGAGAWVVSCAVHPLVVARNTATSMGSHMFGAVMGTAAPVVPPTIDRTPAVVATTTVAPPRAEPSPPAMPAHRAPEYIRMLKQSLGDYAQVRSFTRDNHIMRSNLFARKTARGFTRTTKILAAHALINAMDGNDSILTKPPSDKTESKQLELYCKALLQKDSGLLAAVTKELPEDIKSIVENKSLTATDRVTALIDRIQHDKRHPEPARGAPAPSM